jgi:dienelactone hydrolase
MANTQSNGPISEWIPYRDGTVALTGYLVSAADGRAAPAVLLFPTWLGINASIQVRARRIAALGYSTFVADMFGRPTNVDGGPHAMVDPFLDDRLLMRRRARAALAALQQRDECEPERVVAIGYCFGGCVSLELARDRAGLLGVVSFHGELDTPSPARPGDISGKVLILTGDADPVVPFSRIAEFRDEMRSAAIDFEIDVYGGAMHSFTGEGSLGAQRTPEAVLHPQAEARSWQAMCLFFAEVLGASPTND